MHAMLQTGIMRTKLMVTDCVDILEKQAYYKFMVEPGTSFMGLRELLAK